MSRNRIAGGLKTAVSLVRLHFPRHRFSKIKLRKKAFPVGSSDFLKDLRVIRRDQMLPNFKIVSVIKEFSSSIDGETFLTMIFN